MDESEFLKLAEHTLTHLESTLETLFQTVDLDADFMRRGNVLEITFASGGKIIINSQSVMQELWVAAKSGGYHFRYQDQQWLNTRTQQDLGDCLNTIIAEQTGLTVQVKLTG